ncbi:MAG: glycosyltransferase family 87 protein [Planctomycetota bacterium]
MAPPSRRAPLVLAALLLALGLGLRAAGRPNDGDLVVYYRVCPRVQAGLDLYHLREGPDPTRPTAYIYPPPFALAFAPLCALPFPLLRGLWCALGVLAAFRAAWLAVDLLPRPPSALAVALGLGFWLRYAWSDLNHGQVNLLVAWLTLEGIAAVERAGVGAAPGSAQRGELQRGELLGGALLAAAVALKLTPGLVVAHYLLRGRRRVVAAAGATLAALLLLPALVLGWGRNLDYLARFALEVTPWNARYHAFVGNNAALPGLAARLLAGSADAGQTPRPLLLALPPERALLLARALSLGAFALALALAQRARGVRALALVTAAIPLVSPIAWKPHLVTLILPGAVAGALLLRPGRHRAPLALALLAVGLAGRGPLGRALADAWILWGGTTGGLLLLALGLTLAPDLVPEDGPAPEEHLDPDPELEPGLEPGLDPDPSAGAPPCTTTS